MPEDRCSLVPILGFGIELESFGGSVTEPDETRLEREKRLAARLRDNLKRRKSQQRGRASNEDSAKASAGAPDKLTKPAE